MKIILHFFQILKIGGGGGIFREKKKAIKKGKSGEKDAKMRKTEIFCFTLFMQTKML